MSTYVDGFVMIVPKKNVKKYIKMAEIGKKIWMKHGALEYKECQIDDAAPKHVSLTFGKLTKAKKDETVFFSFIVFKSRAHRDSVNKKVMKDPEMDPGNYADTEMPFDMKKFSYAGFKTVVG